MIKIKFSDPTDKNPFGIIKAECKHEDLGIKFPWDSPLTFQVISTVNKKIKWSSKISPGSWSSFLEPCNTRVEIIDPEGNTISSWEWDTFLHGDESHVLFMLWCLKNKGAKGIAIGTHDGTTGEWVEPLRSGLIEAFLVEASIPQYENLVENYKGVSGCFPLFSLVTPNGGDCEFFEGPDGFTNSVFEDHVMNYNSQVAKTIKKSKSLNDLICEAGLSSDLGWLHLDVEGLDADLIISLDESRVKLPEFIIYESLNLSEVKKAEINKWLSEKGYLYKESGWNTIAHKAKNE
jgi:hypothetical protein